MSFFLEHKNCRLAYKITGSGPNALFIQGTGLHGNGWLPQIKELSKEFRCLTFDNRGVGASRPNTTKITIAQMAEDALALMDDQGWKTAHIIGHSLGGAVAQQIALTAPARVQSLALLCTFAKGSDATALTTKMFWIGMRTYIGTRRMRRHAFLEILLPRKLLATADRDQLAAEFAPLFGHDLADHPPAAMQQLAALRAYDSTPHLKNLATIPTLVVGAEEDVLARPAIVRSLAQNIPNAKLIELQECAHGVPIHSSEKINQLLHEHFSRTET